MLTQDLLLCSMEAHLQVSRSTTIVPFMETEPFTVRCFDLLAPLKAFVELAGGYRHLCMLFSPYLPGCKFTPLVLLCFQLESGRNEG